MSSGLVSFKYEIPVKRIDNNYIIDSIGNTAVLDKSIFTIRFAISTYTALIFAPTTLIVLVSSFSIVT